MAKSRRSCYLCGNTYEYCDCNRQPSFMATFCSENCRDIFKSLCLYGTNTISAEDCKELLDCCDLSNKGSYKESTRNTIDELYAAPVATIEEPEVVVEPVEDVVESVIEELVEDAVVDTIPEIKVERKKRNHEVVIEETE